MSVDGGTVWTGLQAAARHSVTEHSHQLHTLSSPSTQQTAAAASYNMQYELEGPRPRGRPKRTWTEVWKNIIKHANFDKDVRSRWRKLIKDDDQDGCEWMSVSSGTGHLGAARQRAVKRLSV